MALSLVIKEILLSKKVLPFAFIMLIIFPIFLTHQMGKDGSVIIFYLITIVFMIMLPGTISMNESKYDKAYAYLSTTPYSKGQLVLCKYIFDVTAFIIITLIYLVEALLVPQFVYSVDIIIIAVAFLSVSFLRGFMIPLEFKFGYEKTKFISVIVVMLISFGIPLIIKNIGVDFVDNFFIDFFLSLPRYVLNILLFVTGIVMSIISYIISLLIFQNKEL